MSKKDWAGLKFKLMQEIGECIDIIFIKDKLNSLPSESPKFFLRSHEKSDGLSSFIDLLKVQYSQKEIVIPKLNVKNKPSFFKRILLAKKHVARQSYTKYKWQKFDKNVKGVSDGIAYMYFNKDESDLIKEFCKCNKINTNSFLLSTLDVTTLTLLDPNATNDRRKWMVPVNIRMPGEDATGNYVTTLTIFSNGIQSSKQFYEQIKEQLKSGIVWGGRIVANAPKYLGERGLRFFGKRMKSPFIGVCSNLGAWPVDKISIDEDFQWLVASPITSFCPVAVVILEWEDRIGITLQLHKSICENSESSKTFMEQWKSNIQKESSIEISPTLKYVKWADVVSNSERF